MMTRQGAAKHVVLTRTILLGFLSVFVSIGSNCTGADVRGKAVTIPNGGLENNGEGWWFELGRSRLNSLKWVTDDVHEGRTCAKLTYSGEEWLWLNTPRLLDLEPKKEVTLAFYAKCLSGGNALSAGCNSLNRADRSWGRAHDNLWVGEVPKDKKWHELQITFTTPHFDFKNQYVCIKMGPYLEAATVLIDDVRIVSVAEARTATAEPFDESRAAAVEFDLPDEIPRDDFPDVLEREIDGRQWREVTLGKVRVRAPAKVEVTMGFHETFPLVVENRAATKEIVHVSPVERINVYVRTETAEIKGGGRAEVAVGIQTTRAVDFDLVLRAKSSGEERSLPVRVEPRATYPMFGLVEHFMRCPPRERGSFLDRETNLKAEEDMKYLRLLPCQVFRVDGPGCWSVVEREKGTYFFDAADWHVAVTRKFGGSRSVMLLGYEPHWVKPFFDPGEKEKLDHWRDYVRAIARRYRGQVNYWEVWNEPCGFWFERGGRDGKKLYQKDYAEECSPILAAVIKTASEVIRQEDPDGKILTPGFVPGAKEAGTGPYRMMEKLFEMGMGDWVDFINLHIYAGKWLPTTPAQGYKVDGKEMVSWEATLRRWREFDKKITMRDLLDLMRKHGVEKPLWITEFGGHMATHERCQALGILRQVAVLVSEGAKGLHYYEFYDYPHEPSRFQLVRHEDKYRTLGLIAYSQAIRSLTGARYEPERCDIRCGETAEKDLSSRVFGRGEETIICLWSNAANPVEVEIQTKRRCSSAHVATFSPEGRFFVETPLMVGEETGDGATRIVSDSQLVTRLKPLEFRILSLTP